MINEFKDPIMIDPFLLLGKVLGDIFDNIVSAMLNIKYESIKIYLTGTCSDDRKELVIDSTQSV